MPRKQPGRYNYGRQFVRTRKYRGGIVKENVMYRYTDKKKSTKTLVYVKNKKPVK